VSVVYAVINGVFEYVNPSRGLVLDLFSLAFLRFFPPGPTWVIGPVIKSLRVWHQAENAPGRITYTGDVV